jgi:hypothetical protein
LSQSVANPGRWKTHVAVGGLIFAFALAFAVSWGWDVSDESWFLHVADRVASGESLYRDVYLHVTPLSAYILVLLIKIFGAQMLVFRAANALGFAGVMLLASRIDERLDSQRRYSPALLLAIFFLGSPARLLLVLFYSQVANLFLLATFSLWLSWQARGDNRLIVWAGVALGLCFAAKQNVGAYGAVALTVATIAEAWAQRKGPSWAAVAVTRAGAAAALAASLVLLPVALSGGLPRLVDFGLSGMGGYLTRGGMWYFKPVYSLVELFHHPGAVDAMRWINAAVPFLIPIVLFPLLAGVFAVSSRADRATTIAVAAFTGAAMATLYPRADPQHMIFVAPMLVLGLRYCWRELTSETTTLWIPAVSGAAIAGICAGLIMTTASALGRVRSPDYVWSRLPHHRGLMLARVVHDGLERNLVSLNVLPRDGRTFFIAPYAGFYYLASGLHNPMPYDYPYAVALGKNGVAEIEGAIRDGTIARVCVDTGGIPALKAYALEEYVHRNMTRQHDPDFCEQYTRRPESGLRNLPR